MKTFLNYLSEMKRNKHVVLAYGRFNAPTIGHEKLIHKTEDLAKEQGAEAHVVTTHSEGTSKNPLPLSKKVKFIKKVAAKGTRVSHTTPEEPTLLHHLAKLHKQGVRHLTMVAGSDRVGEYESLINKYNGKTGPHGHYKFDSIKVVSAGQRDPDSEGTEGMSGTKLRAKARAGEDIKPALPKALHPHAEEIANHIRAIKEDFESYY